MVSRQDLQRAQRKLNELYHCLNEAESRLGSIRRDARHLRVRVQRIRSYDSFRETLSATLPPLAWAVLAGAAFFAASFLASIYLSWSQGLTVAACLSSMFVGYGIVSLYFMEPNSSTLKSQVDSLSVLLRAGEKAREDLERYVHELRRSYEAQSTLCKQIQDEVERPERILLSRNWQQMQGVEFEDFLFAVFRNLGYVVEKTPASRDHGVDLVAARGDERLAIQAKGFPSGNSVGNDAVLKVVGGMRIYKCSHTVVITNSRFTSAAFEAAQHTGCMLVGRHDIPKLIQGGIC